MIDITRRKLNYNKGLNSICGALTPVEVRIAVDVFDLSLQYRDDVLDHMDEYIKVGKSASYWVYFDPQTGWK